MKQKTIGIIGGAGPQAGVALMERIISFSQSIYACKEDADFPKIILNSVPFSNMLAEDVDNRRVRMELKNGLTELRGNGAAVLAIACNTLHVFLDEENDKREDLIQLPKILAEKISQLNEIPLVLCTSTSVKFNLHKRFFPCVYPDPITQEEVDELIHLILKDGTRSTALKKLIKIIEKQPEKTIVLGCTELSLLKNQLPDFNKEIIDPLDIVALEMLKVSFNE